MWWWIAGGTLGLVVVILALLTLVDVVRKRPGLSDAQFYAWLILVLVLPVVGVILWLVVGRASLDHRRTVTD